MGQREKKEHFPLFHFKYYKHQPPNLRSVLLKKKSVRLSNVICLYRAIHPDVYLSAQSLDSILGLWSSRVHQSGFERTQV